MRFSQESFLSLGPHGFHRVAYTDWGDPANPHVVLCVHGLSRNSRDFDFLADSLSRDCHVVCMDVVGRGDSDWLEEKWDSQFSTYLSDAAALVARVTTPAPCTLPVTWPAGSLIMPGPSLTRVTLTIWSGLAGVPEKRSVEATSVIRMPHGGTTRS